MTWGDQAVRSVRLIAITPLLLTKFDTSEIAAWYLFSSLIFFSDLIGKRVHLTFSRMIAFAMAGATDLSPITQRRERVNSEPNWSLVERTYATTGFLNAILSLLATGISLLMGLYGLQAVAESSSNPEAIWGAFAVFVFSHAISFLFQRYGVALNGLDKVAMVNRWNAVFGLLSITAGFVALSLDVGILGLAVVMQGLSLLGVVRLKWLLQRVEGGRFRTFKAYRVDLEIVKWARAPFFKGLVVLLANSVLLQLATVIYARVAAVDATASLAFSLRMLLTIRQVCEAPFNSHMPKMSRLLAQGDLAALRKIAEKRIMLAQSLFAIGIILLGFLGPIALALLNSNASFVSVEEYFILASLLFIQRTLMFHVMLSAVGNSFVCFKETVVAAITTVALIFGLIPSWGIYGLCVAVFVPQLLILNIRPLMAICWQMEANWWSFLKRSSGVPLVVLFALMTIAVIAKLIVALGYYIA